MDLRELKLQFLNAGVITDDIKVKFKTPNGYTYYNCNCHIIRYNNYNDLVINLIDKTEPTFKVGDKVTNISGLFPDVGYTIAEVNEEEQYYTYKEVNGRTYFSEQNKLMLVEPIKIEPKFKVCDKVKGVLSNNPDKEFLINSVDTQLECYHYFNGSGTTTKFKDQDKLTLVETDNSTPPVEDKLKLASTVKLNPNIIFADDVRINKDIYDTYTLVVQEMMCAIKTAAHQGQTKLHFVIGEKDINVFQLAKDFVDAGYKVSAVINKDSKDSIDIEW